MEQLPTTAMGTLRLFAQTSSQIDVMSDGLIESVKEGEASALEVLTFLKAFEKVAERVKKEIHDNVMKEADLHPGTKFEVMGNQFEKSELGTKYNFEVCNDEEWKELSYKKEDADYELKKRETFLKSLTKPLNVVNGDGEAVTINPPVKTSTSGVKITIR